jgi:hypothetical protein
MYETKEWTRRARTPAIAKHDYKFMSSTKHSKNDIKYPMYGRGKDPNMDFMSYMYNPRLVNKSLFEEEAVSPGRKQYEKKYEKYLREKEVKTPEVKERRWKNFDTGVKGRPRMKLPEHLMGHAKPIRSVVKKNGKKSELLLIFNVKEKEVFVVLREMYNKLDVNNENSVDFNKILNELTDNTKLQDIFSIEDPLELEEESNELELEKPGFITWQELLQLFFKHNPINLESKKEIQKKRPKKKKTKKRKSEQKLPLPPSLARHEFKITVPQPPKFENREKNKKTSIRQQKLIEMFNEEKQEEDKYRNYLIKANPIPITTSQPLYEQIVEEQKRHSEEVKALSCEITKAREKPFSFYERDKELSAKRAVIDNDPLRHVKPFKANPVPDFVRFEMLPEIQRQEEELRELRRQRAYELAKLAHSPPRMEMYEKKEVEVREMEFTFCPKVDVTVPDFKSKQEEFQRELEKVKQNKILTVPEPFNLSSSSKHKHNCQTTHPNITHKTKEEIKEAKREQIRQKLEETRMKLEYKAMKVTI